MSPERAKLVTVLDLRSFGRRDIKIAFQSDSRVERVAVRDGMCQYSGDTDLRKHYLNTGRQLIQMAREQESLRRDQRNLLIAI